MSERLSTRDVAEVVRPHGIEIRELPADTSTSQAAAEALCTTADCIAKSLLFVTGNDAVLVLACGDRPVDTARLAQHLRTHKVRLAKPKEVLRITGYQVGGVPPVGHLAPLRTLIDRRLLARSRIFAAAGASNAIFPATPSQLIEMTAGEVADIS